MTSEQIRTNTPNVGSDRLPARVLVIVEQPVLEDLVRTALSHGHFDIRSAQTWQDISRQAADWRPHLAILDMEFGGELLLDQLGGLANPIPVIALTRGGGLAAKLAAFEHGVDDILTRPFSPDELVARALVAMRRIYSEPFAVTPVIRRGDLEIDLMHRRARAGAHELRLTSVEQSLLYLFVASNGRLLTRDEIMDTVWGADFATESNVVDRHIRNLRVKLRDGWQQPRYIATIPNQGYRFVGGGTTDPC